MARVVRVDDFHAAVNEHGQVRSFSSEPTMVVASDRRATFEAQLQETCPRCQYPLSLTMQAMPHLALYVLTLACDNCKQSVQHQISDMELMAHDDPGPLVQNCVTVMVQKMMGTHAALADTMRNIAQAVVDANKAMVPIRTTLFKTNKVMAKNRAELEGIEIDHGDEYPPDLDFFDYPVQEQ